MKFYKVSKLCRLQYKKVNVTLFRFREDSCLVQPVISCLVFMLEYFQVLMRLEVINFVVIREHSCLCTNI